MSFLNVLSDQRLPTGMHLVNESPHKCRNTQSCVFVCVFEVKTFREFQTPTSVRRLIFHLQPTETHTWKFNVFTFVQPPPPPPPCRLLITGSFPCLSLAFSALQWQLKCWNKTFYLTHESRRADVLHPNLEIRGNGVPAGARFYVQVHPKEISGVKHIWRECVCGHFWGNADWTQGGAIKERKKMCRFSKLNAKIPQLSTSILAWWWRCHQWGSMHNSRTRKLAHFNEMQLVSVTPELLLLRLHLRSSCSFFDINIMMLAVIGKRAIFRLLCLSWTWGLMGV